MGRIAHLSSDLGTPTLVLEHDRRGSAGTIVDLSHTLAGGRLLPGQTTSPQRLQVRLDYVRDVIDIHELVHMQVKVYGTRTGAAKADSATKAP